MQTTGCAGGCFVARTGMSASRRIRLASIPSVQQVVAPDYHHRLPAFLLARESALGARIRGKAAAAA